MLIDCNGQTGRESLPAYAMRPAAVQVSPPPPPSRTNWTRRVPHPVLIGHAASLLQVHYLGFPSTIGATYIDYIIGDPVLPPPPPYRTKWTRRVPHPVLIGHAASLTPY